MDFSSGFDLSPSHRSVSLEISYKCTKTCNNITSNSTRSIRADEPSLVTSVSYLKSIKSLISETDIRTKLEPRAATGQLIETFAQEALKLNWNVRPMVSKKQKIFFFPSFISFIFSRVFLFFAFPCILSQLQDSWDLYHISLLCMWVRKSPYAVRDAVKIAFADDRERERKTWSLFFLFSGAGSSRKLALKAKISWQNCFSFQMFENISLTIINKCCSTSRQQLMHSRNFQTHPTQFRFSRVFLLPEKISDILITTSRVRNITVSSRWGERAEMISFPKKKLMTR